MTAPCLENPFVRHQFVRRASEALEWLEQFVAEPNPDLGRDGAVCPFLAPALNRNAVVFAEDDSTYGLDVEEVTVAMLRHVDRFIEHLAPLQDDLAALAVVFTALPADRSDLLDVAHRRGKTDWTRRGVMVGQFHPRSEERTVRGGTLVVGRSPVPFIAIRSMLLHDILFLHEEREWFRAYQAKFARRYEGKSAVRGPYGEEYRRALARWG